MERMRNWWCLGVAGILYLCLMLGTAPPARAAAEDVALFYDELASYGNWIDYGNYGPVWYPTKVGASWRPYVDGRWTPSPEGWVFESSEPWAWATYHYGNWMPTTDYGWVWYPGSTWYPSTAAWRTSDDYIGWAPVPPPNYVPEPAFYPAEGYYPGMPILDLLSSPFWIFAEAASFLLGFGQPFIPAYSYYNCYDCLAPFGYGPVIYGGTFLLTDFYYPGFAPAGFYCFGPPFPFVSRVGNVNINQFNTFVNNVNFHNLHNVLPGDAVLGRRPFLRDAIPTALREGRAFDVHRVGDIARAERQLNHPDVVRPPGNLPQVTKSIPKVAAATGPAPRNLSGVKGMSLPKQTQRPMTPQMQRQVRTQSKLQPLGRAETKPEYRARVRPEFQPRAGQPARVAPSPEFRATAPSREIAPAPRREITPAPRAITPTPHREVAPTPQREFRAAPAPRVTPTPQMRLPSTPQYHAAPRLAPPPEFRSVPHPSFQAPAPRAAPAPSFHAPSAPAAPRAAPSAPAAPSGGGGHKR